MEPPPVIINDNDNSTFSSSYSLLSEIWHLPHFSPDPDDNSIVPTTTTSRKRSLPPIPIHPDDDDCRNNKHVKVGVGGGRSQQEVNEENGAFKPEADAASVPKEEDLQNAKPPPSKQDYIHVRARRGQATDSHSLAERARREKISDRMKILQDLVPGCNKVIGKTLVLDEIINYIQSLQRQIEFLSMKLEAVNSRMNMNSFPSKYSFDLAGIIFGPQAARGYAQRSQPGFLHMQIASGFDKAT